MDNILFINHKDHNCGIYQYGKRVWNIISKSRKYNFIYVEIGSEQNEVHKYEKLIKEHSPLGILYNYMSYGKFSWLNTKLMKMFPDIKHYKICHEDKDTFAFNYFINDIWPRPEGMYFNTARPIFEDLNITYKHNKVPVIGSFGFGYDNKGYWTLAKLVNEQFDKAHIRIHIPFFHGQLNPDWNTGNIPDFCRKEITKPGISLEFSHEFKTEDELLKFLSENDLNACLYDITDYGSNRGYASTIDYVISVKRPLAITKANMLRHVHSVCPEICIENSTLPEILKMGSGVTNSFREKWSHKTLIKEYEDILDKTISIPEHIIKYVYL